MPIDFQLPDSPPAQVQPPSAPSFDDQYANARALANGGQPELALAAYSALLTRSPGNADVLLGRGVVYSRLGRWNEAVADLSAAASASPDYADVWEALGNTYRWSEQPAKALEAYEHLVALRPKDPAALVARARAQRALGHAFEARADLERARALGGDVGEIDGLLADLQPRPTLPSAGTPDATGAAGYDWAASLASSWTDVGTGPRWNDQTASLRHYMKAGSLGFETLRAHRFGQQDYAWALDGYASLWQGAYANLRYQHSASSRLFPANSGRVEVWQALGQGWEASLSDDVLGFDSRVNIYGISLAKYTGNFYIQLRHQNIVSEDSHSTGERLLARWYYTGDADNYLELSANSGRSDDSLSLVGGRARSGGGGIALVRYFSPQWGGKIGASFSRAASGGAASGNERGISFALYRRW
ncbi:Beta-barrel assembly-enhancing protease [Massilia sp. Bi118]|uniref:YaiO family outer membrane beta-barrel protein n=1 Tax=Massilia sp. Bi118 TaxID=2822346 RepID=UPI001DCC0D85|nr:YaiO family outer membrane beta-barrel protein [Massilia sp. Bi118]CAH0311376.1 Beta-barrel assembly-enhancing protease [Massilia sp. Bi118]